MKVAVFGVPSAAGAGGAGTERAAFVFRAAGLLEGLRGTGARVVNLSDLSMFPYRDDPGQYVFNLFDTAFFGDTPLGWEIAGDEDE